MQPTLREAHFSDCNAVSALHERNGLPVTSSAERWDWLWRENPGFNDAWPIGWILEITGTVVGYLGNLHSRYQFKQRSIRASAAHGFAVDTEFRGHSLRLASAFFSQTEPDVLISTTANEAAGMVYKLFGAQKIPQPAYDEQLLWVLNLSRFTQSYLRTRGGSPLFSLLGGVLLTPVMAVEARLHKRRPKKPTGSLSLRLVRTADIGAEFDELWLRVTNERPDCMLAIRSSAALRWRFGHACAAEKQARVICALRHERVVGYIVIVREHSRRLNLERYRIVDVVVEGNEPAVLDSLFAAAYHQAANDRADFLDMIGFPREIRRHVMMANPYVRRLPAWLFWYKANDPELRESLVDEKSWYASSFDGDASL
jgi:hypothetical protein